MKKKYTGWSATQQRMAVMASSAAGWNEDQRYIAMLACGCPLLSPSDTTTPSSSASSAHSALNSSPRRPSVKNPKNSQHAFEQYMALAETSALARGKKLAGPSMGTGHRTWYDACRAESDRSIAMIRRIAAEACERLPGQFSDPSQLVSGVVRRITAKDAALVIGTSSARVHLAEPHGEILACSPDQVRRVLEALRAWVGRVMHECGVRPLSFEAPRSAVARAGRSRSPVGRAFSPSSDPTPDTEAPF